MKKLMRLTLYALLLCAISRTMLPIDVQEESGTQESLPDSSEGRANLHRAEEEAEEQERNKNLDTRLFKRTSSVDTRDLNTRDDAPKRRDRPAEIKIAIAKHLLPTQKTSEITDETIKTVDQEFKKKFNIQNDAQGDRIIVALNEAYRLLKDEGQHSLDESKSEAQQAFLDQLTKISKLKETLTDKDINTAFLDAEFEKTQKTEHHTRVNWWRRKFSRKYDETITQALHSNPDALQELKNKITGWREGANTSHEEEITKIKETAMKAIAKEYNAIDEDPNLDQTSKASAQRVLLKNALKLVKIFLGDDASRVEIDEYGDVKVTTNTSEQPLRYYSALGTFISPESYREKEIKEDKETFNKLLNKNLSESLADNDKLAKTLYTIVFKWNSDVLGPLLAKELNTKTSGPLTESDINAALEKIKKTEEYKIHQFKRQQVKKWDYSRSKRQWAADELTGDKIITEKDVTQSLLGRTDTLNKLKDFTKVQTESMKSEIKSFIMRIISNEFDAIITDTTTSPEHKAIAKKVLLENALKLVQIFMPDATSVEINGKNNINVTTVTTLNKESTITSTLTYDRSLGWNTSRVRKNDLSDYMDRFFSKGYGKTIEQSWNGITDAEKELEDIAKDLKSKNTPKAKQQIEEILKEIKIQAQEEYDNIEPKTKKAVDAFKKKVLETAQLFSKNPMVTIDKTTEKVTIT